MNKKNIFSILTILWVCLIFSFSLHTGDKSAELSSGVIDVNKNIISSITGKPIDWSYELLETIHLLIRKCAHFLEYLVLGVLTILSLIESKRGYKKSIAFALCVVVASIDETIQRFVPGRSGMVTDVILDSLGSLVGIGFLLLFVKWHQSRSN